MTSSSAHPTELCSGYSESRSPPFTVIGQESEETEDRKTNLKLLFFQKQKREYRDEKKRVMRELLTTLHGPTIVVMADWLKFRGTLRKWNRYFCILKPGLLLVYKSNKVNKQGYWIGTVLLNNCELIERPSKKDGFCFKLFHPMDQSIWATRGPLGESHGAVTIQPLPTTYLICRAPSEQVGSCWMDALQLSLRCSGLLMRTMYKASFYLYEQQEFSESSYSNVADRFLEFSEIEAEKHFDGLNDNIGHAASDTDTGTIEYERESTYIPSDPEQFGPTVQTEDLVEENKSLVWNLLKQIRPGMDLSKVTLPTFILEPRSFLEKLADFYYHSYIIAEAAVENDPLQRMKTIIKFYLSGFYKKPKGLKKPYNPILGETFRCKWEHPDNSTSYYIAEQVSHHPPVSALFLTNRKAGFNVAGTVLAKSKYYGNSLSAMMIGDVRITLLQLEETYSATLPYANCKGLMIGSLSMEYGGQVRIECNRTNYVCELNFKLKPFIGGMVNSIFGDIRYGKESVAHIEGTWDGEIFIVEKDVKTLLWAPTPAEIAKRLKRYEIPLTEQSKWESKKLWSKVTDAIILDDQKAATAEKSKLEDEQRARAKLSAHYKPRWFKQDPLLKNYEYIYADYQPWDENDDIRQVEHEYVIRTKTKHGTKERSASPSSSTSVQQEQSDDSDSLRSKRQRLKKGSLSSQDCARLQQIQETLDRSVHFLQRLEERIENRTAVAVTQQQLIIIIVFFSFFQVIILPLLFGSYKAL
ncbi:unnamed protein product [Thelazia callipaeda]|uniref:Oxysterol-binding protein n=1 Tax=Thelazia callipaeda TaxID=103827 RepID=A0A0N5D009_THECL|nr:unnamed protein product [Thelazia callipaeda]